MADAGRSSADSYIGSLISLTSKSEIRYEGVLYTVDAEESTIALQDVRSFGTEGRKKDGPQIPPNDKVYDYIIFRATDIKDLQVKRSPPAQPSVNDPAIVSVQTQYSGPAPASSFAPPLGGSICGNFHGSYANIPPGAFQSNPLYPPTGPGSWPGCSDGLALPMYWPQYYRPVPGLPHLQQHQPSPSQSSALLPGLNTSITQQQQQSSSLGLPHLQHQPSPFQSSPILPGMHTSMIQQQHESSFQLPQQKLPPNLGPMLASSPVVSFTECVASDSIYHTISGLSSSLTTTATMSSILSPDVSLPASRGLGPIRTNSGKLPGKVGRIMSPTQSSQVSGSFQGPSSFPTTSGSLGGQHGVGTSVSSGLLAPAHLLASGAFSTSGQVLPPMMAPSIAENRLAESPKITAPLISIPQPPSSQQVISEPLLPLPTAPSHQQRQVNQKNGFYVNNYQTWRVRGRGRGRGIGGMQQAIGRGKYNNDNVKFTWVPHAPKHFTEDFDFMAMNEKFNKDEVWGELGKGENKKGASQEELTDNDLAEPEMDFEQPDVCRKSIYVKEDFFDTLSCDALDRERRNERINFSERRKLDTETFGNLTSRPHNGRGGRLGIYRGGYRSTFQGSQGFNSANNSGHMGGNAYRGRFRVVSRTSTESYQ